MLLLDFDGTLFQTGKFIATQDVRRLMELEGQLVRVIATGRSLYSLKKVIDDTFPLDYLIFSTGAGIMDWSTQKIIRASQIPGPLVDQIIDILRASKHSFFVHRSLPDNHYFYYYLGPSLPADFERRFDLYRDFAQPLEKRQKGEAASQILVITNQMVQVEKELQKIRQKINVIRTTSPLDGHSVWLEIFDRGTNKALAAQWLSRRLNILPENTIAIGNDFNDLDLLHWAGKAFVVDSAPEALKKQFNVLNTSESGILLNDEVLF